LKVIPAKKTVSVRQKYRRERPATYENATMRKTK
jgi:hypothetical protein